MTASVELVSTPTLGELSKTANAERVSSMEAGASMVQHAIRCGEALLAAKDLCEPGEWAGWLSDNFDASYTWATTFMRIAHYKDRLDGVSGIGDARVVLKGLPSIVDPGAPQAGHFQGYGDDVRDAIKELRDAGMSFNKIGVELGIHPTTASRLFNPEREEKVRKDMRRYQAKLYAAKKALKEQEKAQTIKKALVKEGQAFNEVYAMLTRMEDLLGQARSETEDREKRCAISEMHGLRNKMRDMAHAMLGVS